MAYITCLSMETENFYQICGFIFADWRIWIENYLGMLPSFNIMKKTHFHQNLSYKVMSPHRQFDILHSANTLYDARAPLRFC